MTERANRKLRIYMAEKNIVDKRIAVNRILEDLRNE